MLIRAVFVSSCAIFLSFPLLVVKADGGFGVEDGEFVVPSFFDERLSSLLPVGARRRDLPTLFPKQSPEIRWRDEASDAVDDDPMNAEVTVQQQRDDLEEDPSSDPLADPLIGGETEYSTLPATTTYSSQNDGTDDKKGGVDVEDQRSLSDHAQKRPAAEDEEGGELSSSSSSFEGRRNSLLLPGFFRRRRPDNGGNPAAAPGAGRGGGFGIPESAVLALFEKFPPRRNDDGRSSSVAAAAAANGGGRASPPPGLGRPAVAQDRMDVLADDAETAADRDVEDFKKEIDRLLSASNDDEGDDGGADLGQGRQNVAQSGPLLSDAPRMVRGPKFGQAGRPNNNQRIPAGAGVGAPGGGNSNRRPNAPGGVRRRGPSSTINSGAVVGNNKNDGRRRRINGAVVAGVGGKRFPAPLGGGGGRNGNNNNNNRPRVRLPAPPPPVSASAGAGASAGFIPVTPPPYSTADVDGGQQRFSTESAAGSDSTPTAASETTRRSSFLDRAQAVFNGHSKGFQGLKLDELSGGGSDLGPSYTTFSEILSRNTSKILDQGSQNAYAKLPAPPTASSGSVFFPDGPDSDSSSSSSSSTSAVSPHDLLATLAGSVQNAVDESVEKLPPFIAKIVEEKLTEEEDELLTSLQSRPGCKVMYTDDLCLDAGPSYPRTQILRSIARSGHLVDFALAEVQHQDADMLIEGITALQEKRYNFDHYFGVTRKGAENHKHRDYAGDGGFLCPSDIKYGRPHMARNAAKEWKYVVNAGQYTQTLRLDKCLKPMDSCSYVSHHYKSECSQVYNFQRLLSWTPDVGIHMDIYKVPVSCSCHIKGYSYQYPPISVPATSSTLKAGEGGSSAVNSVSGSTSSYADDEEPFSLQEELQPYEDNLPQPLFYPASTDVFRPPHRFKPPPPISPFSSPGQQHQQGGHDNNNGFGPVDGFDSPWKPRPTFSHQAPVSGFNDMDAAGSEFIATRSKSPGFQENGGNPRIRPFRRVNYTYHPIVDFMSRRVGEPRSLERPSNPKSFPLVHAAGYRSDDVDSAALFEENNEPAAREIYQQSGSLDDAVLSRPDDASMSADEAPN